MEYEDRMMMLQAMGLTWIVIGINSFIDSSQLRFWKTTIDILILLFGLVTFAISSYTVMHKEGKDGP